MTEEAFDQDHIKAGLDSSLLSDKENALSGPVRLNTVNFFNVERASSLVEVNEWSVELAAQPPGQQRWTETAVV